MIEGESPPNPYTMYPDNLLLHLSFKTRDIGVSTPATSPCDKLLSARMGAPRIPCIIAGATATTGIFASRHCVKRTEGLDYLWYVTSTGYVSRRTRVDR